MAELVDARDLKSLGSQELCRFDSGCPHQGLTAGLSPSPIEDDRSEDERSDVMARVNRVGRHRNAHLMQALALKPGQKTSVRVAIQIFEGVTAFRQHIDLVPGAQLVGGAVVAITPDRR